MRWSGTRDAGIRFWWRGAEAPERATLVAVRSERETYGEHARILDRSRKASLFSEGASLFDAIGDDATNSDLSIHRVVSVGSPLEDPFLDVRRTSTCPRTVGLLGTLARVHRALDRAPRGSATLLLSSDGRLTAGRPSEWGTCRVHASGDVACLVERSQAERGWRVAPILRWTIGEHGPRPAFLGPELGLPRFVPRNDCLLVDPPGALSGNSVDGRRLFHGLVPRLAHVILQCLDEHDLPLEAIAHVVLQHTNARLLSALADELGLSADQIAWNRSFVDDAHCASLGQVFASPDATERSGPILVAEFECGYSITATIVSSPTSSR